VANDNLEFCGICASGLHRVGRGRVVFGRVEYCTQCTEGKSDRAVLEAHLAQEERTFEIFAQSAEKSRTFILGLRKDIPKATNQRFTHLQPVDECRGLTREQKRAIGQGLSFNETWESRQKMLKSIREEHNRKACIEVTYLSDEKKYRVHIFKDSLPTEVVTVPAWNRSGVKRLIDNDETIKVPWRQIVSGQPWCAEIEISPFYIEKTWIPQNLLPFKRVSQNLKCEI
jgi:hypothetical protein